jgi:annexin A13
MSVEVKATLDFIAKRDAEVVHKACAGLGTDDKLLYSLLCARTKRQIQNLNLAYLAAQGKTLLATIDNECGGDYARLLKFVCRTRAQYICYQLEEAMGGIGCDKSLINELFCLSTKEEIFEAKAMYEQRKDSSLSDRLRSELKGEHEAVILNLLLNGRGNETADANIAAQQAEEIYDAIENGSGLMGLKDSAQRKVSY